MIVVKRLGSDHDSPKHISFIINYNFTIESKGSTHFFLVFILEFHLLVNQCEGFQSVSCHKFCRLGIQQHGGKNNNIGKMPFL